MCLLLLKATKINNSAISGRRDRRSPRSIPKCHLEYCSKWSSQYSGLGRQWIDKRQRSKRRGTQHGADVALKCAMVCTAAITATTTAGDGGKPVSSES